MMGLVVLVILFDFDEVEVLYHEFIFFCIEVSGLSLYFSHGANIFMLNLNLSVE